MASEEVAGHRLGAAAIGAIGGALLVSQNGINTNLRNHAWPSGIIVSFISFSVGLVCIFTIALFHRPRCDVSLRHLRKNTPWYAYTGGLLGPTYVIAAVFLSSRLGFAIFQLCATLGQMIGALVCDATGFLSDRGTRRPSPLRLVALAGVSVGTGLTLDIDGLNHEPWWLVMLMCTASLFAGSIFPIQALVNKVLQGRQTIVLLV